ncbi:acetolactate synthase large subunit [endosymbiont of Ridgeia piscesae]|jgi:acetolactate synthase-1/2/3 large subunit|nr:acetolactate synthase large subunit [endosymbiont of Ridgeia piscesae]KRT55117.1 acetolactate synthase, large subunit [endosymbiont of Ridgeia piscesae]KRT60197.1 acetolactate synthase, large subunit [endosymbiont of Ridgeia piscesae]
MPSAAQLLVECLENEGVEMIFGIPGEENLDLMDALLESHIKFITVRHEQGAAFMADVYGRLTGRAGVCLATLGPGATNLITGFADANMDRAPIVAIAGQGATTRMHKESHQLLDLVNLFAPISKYSSEIKEPEIIPELVRKAFKEAQAEKPGGAFISFPENIAGSEMVAPLKPFKVQAPMPPSPPQAKIEQAATLISAAKAPIILAGNGVIRAGASAALVAFAETLKIPVAQTFMAKGVIPFSHPLSLGTVGLQANDYVACGFARADLVICIGFDMVEYHPHLWHPNADKQLIHIDQSAAEVDAHYILEAGVIGDIGESLQRIGALATPQTSPQSGTLRQMIINELDAFADDESFPLKPQRILYDTRQALDADDVLISDVGAHKMWVARLFRAERPNRCIISNGFASMGIGVPGAIAAKMVHPERRVLTITGDAGFMMNSQEIETALRHLIAIVIMIWHDNEYGLIKWHQQRHFGRTSHISFNNPDFVKYAESFGAKGYRVESAETLLPTLQQAFADDTLVVVDVPVDYSENMKLTEKLGQLVCPI